MSERHTLGIVFTESSFEINLAHRRLLLKLKQFTLPPAPLPAPSSQSNTLKQVRKETGEHPMVLLARM